MALFSGLLAKLVLYFEQYIGCNHAVFVASEKLQWDRHSCLSSVAAEHRLSVRRILASMRTYINQTGKSVCPTARTNQRIQSSVRRNKRVLIRVGSERQEILRAFYRLLQAAKKLL